MRRFGRTHQCGDECRAFDCGDLGWRRSELPVMGRVLTVILALIGIGSFLFHTFAQTWQVCRCLPILFILVYIYVATRDYFDASGVSWLAV